MNNHHKFISRSGLDPIDYKSSFMAFLFVFVTSWQDFVILGFADVTPRPMRQSWTVPACVCDRPAWQR